MVTDEMYKGTATTSELHVLVSLPCWWRVYAGMCWYWSVLRGKEFDADKTARFIVKHANCSLKTVKVVKGEFPCR